MDRNLRRRVDLAPHTYLTDPIRARSPGVVTNVVHKAKTVEDAWIEEATSLIGDWRSLSRSVYLRWALTINACELAEARYRDMGQTGLVTKTLRIVDGQPTPVDLAVWAGPEAASHYEATKSLVAAHGVIDLYGAIEDILFEFAGVFYSRHPLNLMQGNEPAMRQLRKLWHNREVSADSRRAWEEAWSVRFDKWRRDAVFRGTPRLLKGVFAAAGLKRPSSYQRTDVDTWASTLQMFAVLRNHVVHGAASVTAELANLCKPPTNLTFEFVEGEPLEVHLHHLQSIECFVDQLLGALNLSLLEKATGRPWGRPLRPGPGGAVSEGDDDGHE